MGFEKVEKLVAEFDPTNKKTKYVNVPQSEEEKEIIRMIADRAERDATWVNRKLIQLALKNGLYRELINV